MLASFGASFTVGHVLCLLVKPVGTREEPSSNFSPYNRKKDYVGRQLHPPSFLLQKKKKNEAELLKVAYRATEQHGNCSSRQGMHGLAWREGMFGCKGFCLCQKLGYQSGRRQMEVILRARSQLTVVS